VDGIPIKSGCKLWWTSRIALNPQLLIPNLKQLFFIWPVSDRFIRNVFVETSLTHSVPSLTHTSGSIKTNAIVNHSRAEGNSFTLPKHCFS